MRGDGHKFMNKLKELELLSAIKKIKQGIGPVVVQYGSH